MKDMIDISLCVPTYKRPKMLLQVIKSFQAQEIDNAELIIIDDCSNDQTEVFVRKAQENDSRIYYEKNNKNIGYCKNFRKTMLTARGKYLFLLGDDDLVLGRDTLSMYVNIFKKQKNIGFIYSNIIQFNNQFAVDYIYRHFVEDRFFKSGKDAICNIWLKSTYAGGIGLQNTTDIEKFFPKEDVLFPLVEMIGKILLDKNAYGLSNYSVGMRVHDDQLGFHMMRKKRVVGRERHATLELHEISDNLIQHIYRFDKTINKKVISDTVRDFLLHADKTILISEGIRLEKRVLLENIFKAIKQEKRIKHTPFFWLQLLIILLLPGFFITSFKEAYRSLLRRFYWRKETWYFNQERSKIFEKKNV